MRIEFLVKGNLPPKKDGAKSMWAKDDETPQFIVALREKALEARSKVGLNECFDSLVAIEFTLFVPKSQLESIGDLDNFIAGICDGLQAADKKVEPHPIFNMPGREGIDPSQALLIENDAKVVSITAKKIALDEDNQELYYKVAVEQVIDSLIESSYNK